MKKISLVIFAIPFILCTDPSKPPDDHTVNRNGTFHNSGDPNTACGRCHGNDLMGSADAPSCYQCHGKKW